MQHIKDNMPFLKAVAYLPKYQTSRLLASGNKEQLRCISEISHNIIAEILKLSEKQKTALTKYKTVIRRLADYSSGQRALQSYTSKKADAISAIVRGVLPQLEEAVG